MTMLMRQHQPGRKVSHCLASSCLVATEEAAEELSLPRKPPNRRLAAKKEEAAKKAAAEDWQATKEEAGSTARSKAAGWSLRKRLPRKPATQHRRPPKKWLEHRRLAANKEAAQKAALKEAAQKATG